MHIPYYSNFSHALRASAIETSSEAQCILFALAILTLKSRCSDDVQNLGTDPSHLFVSGSNLVDNSFYSKLDTSGSAEAKVISSNSRNGSFFGLSQDQVSEIWFQGAAEKVHAWVMKPSNFSSTQRYPLAYLIHGGPQGKPPMIVCEKSSNFNVQMLTANCA